MFVQHENAQDLQAISSAVNARNYSTLAALVFLVLDYICTLQDEVKYIWRAPPYRLPETLYIISRYVPLFVQTTSYVFVHVFLVHHPVSTRHCKVWFSLLGATTGLLGGVTDLILLLRVYALYKKNASVLLFAVPLMAKHVVAQVLVGRTAFGEPSFSELCDLHQTPIIAAPIGALTVASHLGLWYAIFAKWNVSDAPLLSTVVKESHWTLAVFTIPTIIMIPWSFHTRTNPFLVFVWPITLISITLCRILIKVNHLKAKVARSTGTQAGRSVFTTTTDFLFSTILDLDGPIAYHLETNEIVSQVSSVADPNPQTQSSTSKA